MRVTVGQLRGIIREAVEAQQGDFSSVLDGVLQDLYNTNKKIEKAHELAPQGPAKAIIAGLHSDLFNQAAEFRKYVEQLKKLASKGASHAA